MRPLRKGRGSRPWFTIFRFWGSIMATLKAYQGFDSFFPDFNFYVRSYWEDRFFNDSFRQYGGTVYRDVYEVNGYDGSNDLVLSLGGSSFAGGSWGNVTSGTVTGLMESLFDGPVLWTLQGVSVSAVGLYRAALTAGMADDRAIAAQALAGHDLIQLSNGNDRVEGWGGNDRMYGQNGHDTLFAGAGNDMAHGGWGNDRLVGEAGNDHLIGATGSDRLEGGAGSDRLDGGIGRDVMMGGADWQRDVFVFRAPNETIVGANRDVLVQFRAGVDDIDLSLMDAYSGRAGNQAFAFSGGAAAHSVWAVAQAGGTIVRGDVNGDRTADFEIWVADVARLSAGDFIL